jgi:UDPglucose 6-dehydrogenase
VSSNKVVTILGAGYVGLTTAALLAESGIETYLIDVDETKIQSIKNKVSPFFEPGLDNLIAKSLSSGNLKPTTSYETAVPKSNYVFCCVGTPDRADGSSNLDYVFAALQKAASLAQDGVVLVQKSTVPVGTGKQVIHAIKKTAPKLDFHYVSNPEFLREGTAIGDSLYPDRTVLGGSDQKVLSQVADIYKQLYRTAPSIDQTMNSDQEPADDFIYTTLESAELIKVTANAFLALKISFANSIAKLCDNVAADINEVMDGIGKDKRIGRAFLNAGRGYGGGCFPKDVSGLIATAAEHNTDLEIMSAAVHLNNSMAHHIIDKIENRHQALKGNRVAVLGLSFKSGTSDSRRSPALNLANLLAEKGALVSVYDPEAIVEKYDKLDDSISRKNSLGEAVKNTEIVLVATDWPEFISMDFKNVKDLMQGDLLVDCMNALDEQKVISTGLTYMGVGRF